MGNRQYCTAVFLDVSQAFDKVWHPGLLFKIKRLLPLKYFNLLKSYLSDLCKLQTKLALVSNRATKYAVSNVSTYKYISWFVEGFRRWRGYILAPKGNPDLQGSCSLANNCSLSVRSEQNSSKLRHTACDIYRRPLAFSRVHCVTRLKGIHH
jgi:hypothetical protein